MEPLASLSLSSLSGVSLTPEPRPQRHYQVDDDDDVGGFEDILAPEALLTSHSEDKSVEVYVQGGDRDDGRITGKLHVGRHPKNGAAIWLVTVTQVTVPTLLLLVLSFVSLLVLSLLLLLLLLTVTQVRQRVLYGQPTGPNPPSHLDDSSIPAVRHGSLNPLFHVA